MSNLAQKPSNMATKDTESAEGSVSTSSPSPAGSGADIANASRASSLLGTRASGRGLHRLETNNGSVHAGRPGSFLMSPSEDGNAEGALGVSLSPGASEISPLDEDKPLTRSNFSLLRWLRARASYDHDELPADTGDAAQVPLPPSSASSPTSDSDSGSWETISFSSASGHDSGSLDASARHSSSSGSWASGERRVDVSGWPSGSSDPYDSDGHSSRTEILRGYAGSSWERPPPGLLLDVPSLTSGESMSSSASTVPPSDNSGSSVVEYLERWRLPLNEDEDVIFEGEPLFGEGPFIEGEPFFGEEPLFLDQGVFEDASLFEERASSNEELDDDCDSVS